MLKILDFLSRYKWASVLLTVIYFIGVVLPHEIVGAFIARTMAIPLGRQKYNATILMIAGVLLILLALWAYKKFKILDKQNLIFLSRLLILNLIFILIALKVIIVINVELIHIIQYAIMALLLLPLIRNYKETLFWAVFLGAVDEWYQYVVLAPGKNDYYDFNDVIINMLGVILGLIIARLAGWKQTRTIDLKTSSITIGLLVMVFSIFLGWMTGYVSIYPPEETDTKIVFSFIREYSEGFWHTLPKAQPFHIVRPLEACVILWLLFFIFKDIGKVFELRH